MTVHLPQRIELARLGTPLEYLARTSHELGREIYLKRDDMTGTELSGNKVRKLEYLFAEAMAQGADTVITCGGEQSNHCRATAMAAARLGLSSVVVLRTDDPANPPPTTANILLDELAGAEIVWISRADWANRRSILEREAARVRTEGREPYIIPEGGSNATGAWGYVGCALELQADLAKLPERPTTIVYSCGSGGTGAGLIIGAKLLKFHEQGINVTGINVCDDRGYFVEAISHIIMEFALKFSVSITVSSDDIDMLDGFVGRGYAKTQPAEVETIRSLARREGVVLDPVYTGKAFHGLVTTLAADPLRFGERIVFVHTGGLFGTFPFAADLKNP